MEDRLINILDSLYGNIPIYRQGSLGKSEPYPESFFTFWNTDSPEHAHYDNNAYGAVWAFRVCFYSSDPARVYTALNDAVNALKQDGWVVPSRGYDVPSDEETHTGRAVDVMFLEV